MVKIFENRNIPQSLGRWVDPAYKIRNNRSENKLSKLKRDLCLILYLFFVLGFRIKM